MKTIIAAFGDDAAARQAGDYLRAHAVENLRTLDQRSTDDLVDRFESAGAPHEKAESYAELARRGCSLLIADAPDENADALASELDRMGSLDVDAAATRWREGGWTGYDRSASSYDEEAAERERRALREESIFEADAADEAAEGERRALREESRLEAEGMGEDVNLVEEHVRIGKREVSRGGVRIRTFVVERPVREEVQLREEHIDIRREPVNEPIGRAEAEAALTEDEVIVTATGEEAVVGKEARIVERVHVGKTTETRTETIEDTERHQEVEVEPTEPRPPQR